MPYYTNYVLFLCQVFTGFPFHFLGTQIISLIIKNCNRCYTQFWQNSLIPFPLGLVDMTHRKYRHPQLHGRRHPKCPALTQPLECLTATSKLPCDWTTVLGQRHQLFPLALQRHIGNAFTTAFLYSLQGFQYAKEGFEYRTMGLFILLEALYSVYNLMVFIQSFQKQNRVEVPLKSLKLKLRWP